MTIGPGAQAVADELIVDRAREQAEIVRSLREAMGGSPRVLLIEGQAGLGKSRLLRWLGAAAVDSGARLLAGTALDGIDVPYLVWSGLAEAAPEAFGSGTGGEATGDEATSTAHLVSAASAVFALAARQPLTILLDDIQWADPASALLLQHLVFAAGSRAGPLPLVLGVATRPPTDESPATAAVRRIVREPIVRRIPLAPLSEVGVGELVASLRGRRPTSAELHDIVDRTAGNPLFVRSWLSVQAGRTGDAEAESAGVVHQLIGGRVRGLSARAVAVLEAMAVIADGCPAPLYDLLASPDGVEVTAELAGAGLVTIDDGRVDFVHTLFRQAQLDRMGEPRIAQVRADVATRLSGSPLVDELPAGLVVDIFRRAPGVASNEHQTSLALRAADEAFAAGGWSRAADLYALAADRDADRGVDVPPAALLRWGISRFRDHDVASVDLLRRAAAAARAAGDVGSATSGLVLAVRARLTLGGGAPTEEIEAEVLAVAEDPDPALAPYRPALFGIAAECCFARFDTVRGTELAARAREVIGAGTDPASLWAVEIAEGLQLAAVLDHVGARNCFADAVGTRWGEESAWHRASAHARVAMVDFVTGSLDKVGVELADAVRCAGDAHHWSELAFSGALATAVAALRGDPTVELVAADAHLMLRRSEYQFAATILHPALALSRTVRGDPEGAVHALDAMREVGLRGRRFRTSISVLSGADPGNLTRHRPPGPLSLYTLSDHAAALQVASATNDGATVERLLPGLAREVECGAMFSLDWPYLLPRVLAEAGTMVADRRASHWLEMTDEVARRHQLVPDALLARLLRARIVAAGGDADGAVRHCTEVIRSADASGLLAIVRLAQRTLDGLGASDRATLISRVVLVTDIVTSTELVRRLGDAAWVDFLDEHDRTISSAVRARGGVVFHHTGDGVCAWFSDANDAIGCARSLLATFEDSSFGGGVDRVDIRIGLARGRPIPRDDDLFGLTMVEAVRLCAGAEPGTGLASHAVHEELQSPLASGGLRSFKGFDDPVATFVVTR